MGARIDHDHTMEPGDNSEYDRTGYELWGGLTGTDTVRFKLRDDDGEIYYSGRMDRDMYTQHEDEGDGTEPSAYLLLKWAEGDSGCTDLLIHVADSQAPVEYVERMRGYGYVFKVKGNPHDWMTEIG